MSSLEAQSMQAHTNRIKDDISQLDAEIAAINQELFTFGSQTNE